MVDGEEPIWMFGGLNEYHDEVRDLTYYSWKKIYQDDLPKRESGRDKLKKEISEHNQELNQNPTFGKSGPQSIPVDITYQNFTVLPPEGRENSGLEWFIFEGTPSSFELKLIIFLLNLMKKDKLLRRI